MMKIAENRPRGLDKRLVFLFLAPICIFYAFGWSMLYLGELLKIKKDRS